MSQTTKMITLLHLLMASTLIESKFGFPDNVNFVTQLYNTSNCSNPSFKNFTLDNLCFKTSIVNGYPECCQELLSEITKRLTADHRTDLVAVDIDIASLDALCNFFGAV